MHFMDGWARPAPIPSPTIIAPVQTVRAPDDSKRLRDKHKERSGDDTGSDHRQAADNPDAPLPPPYLALQTIDPDTGCVYWQSPSPTDRLAAALEPGSRALSSRSRVHARLTGLLGKRAYEKRLSGRRELPRIARTA